MEAAARILRVAFDDRLPWLGGLHTPEEDSRFLRERVFSACEIWGAFDATTLIGFIAFREGWIDHLYVVPSFQGQGLGSALLERARSTFPRLSLWTFQRNRQAREFYEAKGFMLVRETDGVDNEEHEPDALYTWSSAARPEHHRVDHQPQLVDQSLIDQGAHEHSARVHDDVSVQLLLHFEACFTTSPSRTVELLQSGSTSVEDTTYVGMLFNLSAHSPLRAGHRAAKYS